MLRSDESRTIPGMRVMVRPRLEEPDFQHGLLRNG